MSPPLEINVTDLLKPGVYLLGLHGRVTYIGKAKCILIALSGHIFRNRQLDLPSWFPIKAIHFDSISIIPCDSTRAAALAEGLISLHHPIHNRTHAQRASGASTAPSQSPSEASTTQASPSNPNHVRRI